MEEKTESTILGSDAALKEIIIKMKKLGRHFRLQSNLNWQLGHDGKFPKIKAVNTITELQKSDESLASLGEKKCLECFLCKGMVVVPVGFFDNADFDYLVHPNIQVCLGCGLDIVANNSSRRVLNRFLCPVPTCKEAHVLVVGEWSEDAKKLVEEVTIVCYDCGKKMYLNEFPFHKLADYRDECSVSQGNLTVRQLAGERATQAEQSWLNSRMLKLLNLLKGYLLKSELKCLAAYQLLQKDEVLSSSAVSDSSLLSFSNFSDSPASPISLFNNINIPVSVLNHVEVQDQVSDQSQIEMEMGIVQEGFHATGVKRRWSSSSDDI